MGVCRAGLSLISRLGVSGVFESSDELEFWPGMVGGLLNLGVPDLRDAGVGRISAGGASDLDGGETWWCLGEGLCATE